MGNSQPKGDGPEVKRQRMDSITSVSLQRRTRLQREIFRLQLRDTVQEMLVQIAQMSTIPKDPGDFCGDIRASRVEHRMLYIHFPNYGNWLSLALFGQCTDVVPYLSFDLRHHTLTEWLRLHATTIRCAVEKCGSGFVFLSWYWYSAFHRRILGHETALYLDVQQNTQVLIDPSLGLPHEVLRYFNENHIWIPRSKNPRVWVVNEPVQVCFRPPTPARGDPFGCAAFFMISENSILSISEAVAQRFLF